MKNIFKNKRVRGFAMVEAMVAITILLVVVTAPLTLAYQIEKRSRIASTRAQATYLANEGIELMIFFRKSLETYCTTYPTVDECAQGSSAATTSFAMFLSKMSAVCLDTGTCRFDKTSFDPNNASYADNPTCTLLYRNSFGEYVCNQTASSTRFSRYVSLSRSDRWKDRSAANQWYTGVKIISTVCYDNGICNDKIQLTSYVYQ
jgi:Tfp pilus assembly protein PilV